MFRRNIILLTTLAALAPACVADPTSEEVGDDQEELEGDEPEDFHCEVVGETRACASEHYDITGTQTCTDYGDDFETQWGACEFDSEPTCGEGFEWNGTCCIDDFIGACCDYVEECNTPLVLSFDDAPVLYTTEMRGDFDLTGRGMSLATDWPTAATPWLALDRDGDGRIADGGELFGSATRLADGSLATNGFVALAELDDNDDGRITPNDAAWSTLSVWSDRDASRSSVASELSSVSTAGLLWIDLAYAVSPRCDARGNCEMERARFAYFDGQRVREGAIVDVHLMSQ